MKHMRGFAWRHGSAQQVICKLLVLWLWCRHLCRGARGVVCTCGPHLEDLRVYELWHLLICRLLVNLWQGCRRSWRWRQWLLLCGLGGPTWCSRPSSVPAPRAGAWRQPHRRGKRFHNVVVAAEVRVLDWVGDPVSRLLFFVAIKLRVAVLALDVSVSGGFLRKSA